jgi:alanine racemase
MLNGNLTWAEINLDAIAHNVKAYKNHVGPDVEVMAVVKANAYGHGAAPVAKAALEAGAARLAVHRLHEAVELRKAGLTAPILIMGYTPPEAAEAVVRWRLTPSLITLEFAQALSEKASTGSDPVPVHIKMDSGMSRYGLMPPEVPDFARAVRELPGLVLEGLFTHFATADALDQTYMRRQLAEFNAVIIALRIAGIEIPLTHAANSAAAMTLPESHFDAVRIGVAMYGLHPSNEWPPVFPIQPALCLKSSVCRVFDLPAGAGISYGRTFVTEKPIKAALVPVGYGDGYHRVLSNKAEVLIHGRRAPIRGRVCMDQFVVEVTHIPQVRIGDEVVLVGAQDGAVINSEEVARLAGTINYEITTALLPRVPRFYFSGRELVDQSGSGGVDL